MSDYKTLSRVAYLEENSDNILLKCFMLLEQRILTLICTSNSEKMNSKEQQRSHRSSNNAIIILCVLHFAHDGFAQICTIFT